MPLIDFAILTGLGEEFEVVRAIFLQLKEDSPRDVLRTGSDRHALWR